MDPVSRIELLAPAGDERALRAALAAGADAVYFGLDRWSARAFAGNFAGDRAAGVVDLAHLYGARAHLALNTLLRDDEFEPALSALAAPYAAGLDAVIVADLGFAALVRARYPDLALHASTQLNTHSSAQLAGLARLGFARAILARELSVGEIAALDTHGVELEVFVHGALCYGYSGDCLLSSMIGGRSGNRGRCSQSCRMRYRLERAGDEDRPGGASGTTDRAGDAGSGRRRPAGAGLDRVLSTADLCALDALPALIDAGVCSFKIEGRMKDAGYVAVTTAVYREALDSALAAPAAYAVRPAWHSRLEQSFSRGFTAAHLEGRHAGVRSGGRGGHRGVLVGRVASVDEERGEAVVRLARPVAAGDVVCLYTPWGQTEPVRVHAAAQERLTLRVRERVALKDRLFRLSAAETDELARELTSGRRVLRPIRLDARLEGVGGQVAKLTLRALPGGPAAEALSTQTLAPARTVALDAARVRAAVGALGGTPYELGELEVALAPALFLPVSELKDMRRRAVEALDERRLAARRRAATDERVPSAERGTPAGRSGSAAHPVSAAHPASTVRPGSAARAAAAGSAGRRGASEVVLLVRLGEAPTVSPDTGAVCLDLAAGDPPEAVADAFFHLGRRGLPVRCRLPEVLFDADAGWLAAVTALPWAAVHARHLAVALPPAGPSAAAPTAIPATAGRVAARSTHTVPLVLEYPLHGLSGATAAVIRDLTGRSPAAVVVSPEASLDEIATLAATLGRLEPAPAVEVLAFGRVQVLRTRDRLGSAEGLIGPARAGDLVTLSLEDAKGYVFPVEVDDRGTQVFNARVTNLAGNFEELRAAGVAGFLVVQRDLSPDEGRAFASGGLPALVAFVARERTTTGHLFRGVA